MLRRGGQTDPHRMLPPPGRSATRCPEPPRSDAGSRAAAGRQWRVWRRFHRTRRLPAMRMQKGHRLFTDRPLAGPSIRTLVKSPIAAGNAVPGCFDVNRRHCRRISLPRRNPGHAAGPVAGNYERTSSAAHSGGSDDGGHNSRAATSAAPKPIPVPAKMPIAPPLVTSLANSTLAVTTTDSTPSLALGGHADKGI